MTSIRSLRPTLHVVCIGLALACGSLASAQSGNGPNSDEPPTTNLPFAPTVQSAPPERSTYPTRTPAVTDAPPPADTLCDEIGPYIRAGVVSSRFATLSASTDLGEPIGSFEAGAPLKELGAMICTVVIPGADQATAASMYNQVTCPLAMSQSDTPSLDELRTRQTDLATRISECPAVDRWIGTAPATQPMTGGDAIEDYLFSHPDVDVEMIVRAQSHQKTGRWPDDYVKTLSLVFRAPNPNRPPPPETARD